MNYQCISWYQYLQRTSIGWQICGLPRLSCLLDAAWAPVMWVAKFRVLLISEEFSRQTVNVSDRFEMFESFCDVRDGLCSRDNCDHYSGVHASSSRKPRVAKCLSLDGSCAGPVALLSQSAREGLDDYLSKKTWDFSHPFCHTCDAPSCHISACVTLASQVLARGKQTWSSLGIANCGSLNLDQKTFTRTRELVSNKYRFRVLQQTQCWRIHENSLKSQCLFARRPPWPYSSTQGVLAPEAEFVCCLLQVSLFARHCKTWHCTSFAFLVAHVRTPHSSDPPQCLPLYSPLFASFVTAETWHNAAGMEQDWDVSRWEVSCLSLSWAKHSHTLESQRLRLCSSGRRTEELSGLPSLACHQRRCAMLCHVLQKLHRTRLVEGRSLGQVFAVRQPPQSQVSTQAGSSMYEEIYKRCI